MIEFRQGSIFDSQAQVLVNSVNCCGVMGGGIALEFKNRYPKMYKAYREACRDGILQIGRPMLWKSDTAWVLNFPSKLHFVQPSRLEYIEKGLQWIAENYQQEGIMSIALPQIGTDLGGLEWEDVKQLICKYLGHLDGLRVEVYEYAGRPSRPRRRRQTAKRS